MNDTKEYIIDQAYNLLLSRSYEAVSISDISSGMNLTKGALYHHFTNKEELFKAVIDKYFLLFEFETDVENLTLKKFNKVAVENVRKIILHIFVNKTKFDPINYMSLIVDGYRHYKGFSERLEKFMAKEIKKIKQVLDSAIKNGEIRSDIDTNIISQNYFSTAVGLAGNILKTNSVDKAIRSLEEQINQLYLLLKK
jgi:TetR/AcrR family transcriptional regulator, transcriptional repressor for nem operon